MRKYMSAVVLALVVTATIAPAQVLSRGVVADVPFAFMVGGKSLPAGTYKFTPGNDLAKVIVTDARGRDSAMTLVVTRITQRSEDSAAVVFDVAGAEHYLAEIYVPGIDGFLVPCAPGDHTHVVVKGRK